jgi:hypothetical protein
VWSGAVPFALNRSTCVRRSAPSSLPTLIDVDIGFRVVREID